MGLKRKHDRPSNVYVLYRTGYDDETTVTSELMLSIHRTRGGALQRVNDEIWGDWCEEHGVPEGCPDPKDWKQVEPWRWVNDVAGLVLRMRAKALEE